MASSRLNLILRAGKNAARVSANMSTASASLPTTPAVVDEPEEDQPGIDTRRSEAARYGSTRIGMVQLPSQLRDAVANKIDGERMAFFAVSRLFFL
jgi:hypothetical protein